MSEIFTAVPLFGWAIIVGIVTIAIFVVIRIISQPGIKPRGGPRGGGGGGGGSGDDDDKRIPR